MKRRTALRVLVMLLPLGALAHAGDSPTADEIAGHVVQSSSFGWEGGKTVVKMTLTEKGGATQERTLEIIARRKNGLLQSVVRLRAPADVAGTAFLTIEKESGKSEQYVYLPGLKRTRRVVGREQEGSFMGSDFTYADLRRADVRDAAHTKKADAKVGDDAVYVIESVPAKKLKSAYTKVESFVRKSDYIPLRTRFRDSQGLLKTLYARRIKQVDGHPVVMDALMENAQSGHSTRLTVESSERRDDLPDDAFTPAALERD